MPQIEYDIFLEAAGNRALSPDKIQIGFKHMENGEITHSESFSIPELEAHIKTLAEKGRDSGIYREALDEAKSSGA